MIICPYVNLSPETKETLLAYAPETEFVYTGKNDFSYWQAIKRCWTGKEDLIIVEQDIVVTDGTIEDLSNCPRAWCTYAYRITATFTLDDGSFLSLPSLCQHALGCTKISAEAQREVAFVPAIRWHELDKAIRFALMSIGGRSPLTLQQLWYPHCHGTVRHLHEE